jgi:hypothetical protein
MWGSAEEHRKCAFRAFFLSRRGENARKRPVLLPPELSAETVPARARSAPDFTLRDQRVEASQFLRSTQKNFNGVGGP